MNWVESVITNLRICYNEFSRIRYNEFNLESVITNLAEFIILTHFRIRFNEFKKNRNHEF